MPILKKHCLICNQNINCKYLFAHLSGHFDYRPYHCGHDQCECKYSDEQQIYLHFESKHENVKKVVVISNTKAELVLSWIIENYDYLYSNNCNTSKLSQVVRNKTTQILTKLQSICLQNNDQHSETEKNSFVKSDIFETTTGENHAAVKTEIFANTSGTKMPTPTIRAKKSIYSFMSNKYKISSIVNSYESKVETSTIPEFSNGYQPITLNHKPMLPTEVKSSGYKPFVPKKTPKIVLKKQKTTGSNSRKAHKYWSMTVNSVKHITTSRKPPSLATMTAQQKGDVMVVSGRKPPPPRPNGQGLTHPRKSHKTRTTMIRGGKNLQKQIIIAGNSYASCQLCQRLVQAYPSHVETHVLQHLRDENKLQWVAACLLCPPNAQLRTLYRSNLIRIHLTRKHGQQNPQPGIHYLDHTDQYAEMIEQKKSICFPTHDIKCSAATSVPLVINGNGAAHVDEAAFPDTSDADDAPNFDDSANVDSFTEFADDNSDNFLTTEDSDGMVVLNTDAADNSSQLLKLCIKCNRNVVNSPSFRKKHVLSHLLDERKIDWLLSCLLCPIDRRYRSISHEDLIKNHMPNVHNIERALVNVHYVDKTADYKYLINETAENYLI